MKPTYTVRLTEDLDPAERALVAERVAGAADIDRAKLERLLERGQGKDLIRPSSASVANRLASVLAEAGAPIELVPIGGEAEEPVEVAAAGGATGREEALRERAPEPAPEPEPAAASEAAPEPAPAPEPAAERASARPGEAPPKPEVRTESPPPEPARPSTRVEPPPPPPQPRGNGLLGAVGAVLLGIGAVFGMTFLVEPLAIGILILAALALGLSVLGQRRATWLPGLGALALIAWALANADDGVVTSLAEHWEWYAMLAGSLLVMVAGWREAPTHRAL